MAQEGYLRIAIDKETNTGTPFVSVLIVDDPTDTEGGVWYSIFDAWWFKGTEGHPSVYDIRTFASKSNPTKVVFAYTKSKDGKFRNITQIRPAGEKWAVPTASNQALDTDVKDEAGKSTVGPDEGKESLPEATADGRKLIAEAIAEFAIKLTDGIALVVSERMKEE